MIRSNTVRDIIAKDPPPPGLKAFVSGAAPLASDTLSIANASLNNVTIITIILILVMLMFVYRSPPTLLPVLLGVLIEMLFAKGLISFLGHHGWLELSSFAVNIVIALTLGAGTDYGIFLMGRYHEARQAGESREDSFYIAYKGVTPIIIGSGLTIAGACYCLTFARLNYFHTMGPAVAITMLFTIAAALTLGPAILTVGSLFGMFDPRQAAKAHRVSANRRERGALAGADPGRQFGHRHVGCDLRAELSAELRRSAVPAAQRRSRIWVSKPPTDISPRANCSPKC